MRSILNQVQAHRTSPFHFVQKWVTAHNSIINSSSKTGKPSVPLREEEGEETAMDQDTVFQGGNSANVEGPPMDDGMPWNNNQPLSGDTGSMVVVPP